MYVCMYVMLHYYINQEAVQLYRKTISVLTKHSHVLSFKNIKVQINVCMDIYVYNMYVCMYVCMYV